MKKALTIGELLVTMAIIGVIAMVVLPSFMKDYHNKLYVTRLKKAYEMLDTAINQACIDNNVSYFYQTPYASVHVKHQDFIDKYFKKSSDNKTYPFASKYVTMNTGVASDTSLNKAEGNDHVWAKLAGGEAISYLCFNYPSNGCVFRVDINSTDGPNVGGRDLFSLYVDMTTNRIFDYHEAKDCGTSNMGEGCLAKIIEDNWEMKY